MVVCLLLEWDVGENLEVFFECVCDFVEGVLLLVDVCVVSDCCLSVEEYLLCVLEDEFGCDL